MKTPLNIETSYPKIKKVVDWTPLILKTITTIAFLVLFSFLFAATTGYNPFKFILLFLGCSLFGAGPKLISDAFKEIFTKK